MEIHRSSGRLETIQIIDRQSVIDASHTRPLLLAIVAKECTQFGRVCLDVRQKQMRLFFRSQKFRTRSPDRDLSSDRKSFEAVKAALDAAIDNFERQKAGLTARMDDALGRASLAVGNDVYEHEDRDTLTSDKLRQFERELASARSRLMTVETHLTNVRSLKDEFLRRFPDLPT